MAYFATPFIFDNVMNYYNYQYTYTSVPTDAASYAANVTWLDSRIQPTWISITSGAIWSGYNTSYQLNTAIVCGQGDTALSALTTNIENLIPPAQVQSDWNSTSGASKILNKPAIPVLPTRSQQIVSRSFNTAFQPSATTDGICTYSVSLATTLTLTGGQSGTISLQTSPTSGGTYTEQARLTNVNTGSVVVGVSLTQTFGSSLSAYVPAGYYVKLVTSGTATTSYITGQEALF